MSVRMFSDYSETTKRLIRVLSTFLEEDSLDFYPVKYDASVEDILDAMEYIASKKWLDYQPIYARKIVGRDYLTSRGGDLVTMGVAFARDLDSFDKHPNAFRALDTFPTIVVNVNDIGACIYENEMFYSLEEWKTVHRMDLKKGDAVIVSKVGYEPAFSKAIGTAYYMGEQKTDYENDQELYLLANSLTANGYYCVHGIDYAKAYLDSGEPDDHYFLTYPEYRFQLQCYNEALEKVGLMLNADNTMNLEDSGPTMK